MGRHSINSNIENIGIAQNIKIIIVSKIVKMIPGDDWTQTIYSTNGLGCLLDVAQILENII